MRVAVTTDRFSEVAPHFARLGLEPVPTPCIVMTPASVERLDAARVAADAADLLVLGSARTVELLWPAGGMPSCGVAAVGPATARAVIAAGGRVVTTGEGGLAELVDSLADRLAGLRVVLLRAAGSDTMATRRLEDLASHLEDHVVYRVQPVGPEPIEVDAVAFASPSAVQGWLLTRSLDRLVIGVIGETTAAAVSSHREPDVVAPRPSFPALADAISSWLKEAS